MLKKEEKYIKHKAKVLWTMLVIIIISLSIVFYFIFTAEKPIRIATSFRVQVIDTENMLQGISPVVS